MKSFILNKSKVFTYRLVIQIIVVSNITPPLCKTDTLLDQDYSNFMLLALLLIIILQDFESRYISCYVKSAIHDKGQFVAAAYLNRLW